MDRKPCANPACKRWAHHGYRYCVDCGNKVQRELEDSKYLTGYWEDYRKPRSPESRENITETKHGI